MPDLFDRYVATVQEWAPRLDLVSPKDLERFRERHVDDSLRVLPLLDELPDGPCVDVGSGAGLPGVPLAIADPSRHWTLLEPRRRRAAFLEEVVRRLALENCEVRALTAEEAAREPELAGRHVLATARAVADAPAVRELSEPLLVPGGLTLVFSGRSAAAPDDAVEWAPGLTIMRKRG
ncbi:MAG TPA: 16S rRNA (guanine(527)-N(7))-methyltransferase RsmG [Actinomycetota bacterium]|nr:16S rRNA (guanine(527)-N(7))-methyltransferase RsmG [Actinomycetota bacterium]